MPRSSAMPEKSKAGAWMNPLLGTSGKDFGKAVSSRNKSKNDSKPNKK